ncbi:MAG: MFS transporter [Nitrososphaerota archaeon]|nr:MFS transporter [Nitrososphaerota archaeon]
MAQETAQKRHTSANWLLTLIPFNAAAAAIAAFVPLQIWALGHHNVILVGLAAVVGNLALVPAPLVWGKVCDRTGARKKIVVAGCVLLLAASAGMLLYDNVAGIMVFYALAAHAGGMLAPSVSLLLMESLPKDDWDSGYTSSTFYSYIGQIVGVALGVVWVVFLPLGTFATACSAFAAAAVALALILVRDPEVTIERRSVIMHPHGFLARLGQVPLVFIRIPRPSDFDMMWRAAKKSLTRELPVIFIASLLFSASANIFFTSYMPFVKSNGLSDASAIFLSVFITVANAVASMLLIKRLKGKVSNSAASRALSLRALAMLGASFFAVFLSGPDTFYGSLLVYGVLGTAYVFINVNMNMLLFKALPPGRQGGVLGVFSTLNGAALLIGSLASGYVSYYLGYSITFFVGGVLVLLSAVTLAAHYGGLGELSDVTEW